MPVKSITSSRRIFGPDRPLRILAVGGGTGLSTLLQGLKYYARPELCAAPGAPGIGLPEDLRLEITAVVTVTDDGGSSGRLRREFDVQPPGDIRNCMVALSSDEALLSRLFQYRFSSGRGLKGHSFGNLFLAVLTQLTGDFAHAVKVSSEVLASSGRIFPSTAGNVVLQARLEDGSLVTGETRISKSRSRISSVFLKPRRPLPLPETLEAIEQADLITFGPGSLFTSVIPNLLVDGIPEAIRRSQAIKAYFCNLMWQPGETMNFRASDHVTAIHKHARGKLLEDVIVNTNPISTQLRRRYAIEKAMPVEVDAARLKGMGLRVLEEPLLAESDKVRHDPHLAAAVTLRLAMEGWRRRQSLLRPLAAGGTL
ncbi:MAG: uridine diphosphate-N-acetylglucosamine-binding protein YvcK [Acidobacteria bacterium]|nr:uridine diphosphate-N-acetylglucosamine-binding protein YvcK [Acidobacteriota bacterium]